MKRRLFIFLVLGFASLTARGLTLEEALDPRAREKSAHSTGQDCVRTSRRAASRFSFHRAARRDGAHAPRRARRLSRGTNRDRSVRDLRRFFFANHCSKRRFRRLVRRGDIEVLLAAQRLNVAVVEQLHQVRVAFYTALYDRSLEALGRSQRLRLDANLTSEEARYQAGSIDRGALASATLLVRNLDPQIEEAHRGYGDAILQLATAMGDDLSPGATLPSPQGTLDFQPVNFPLERETSARARAPRRPAPGAPSRSRRAAKTSESSRPLLIRSSTSNFLAATFRRPNIPQASTGSPSAPKTASLPKSSTASPTRGA